MQASQLQYPVGTSRNTAARAADGGLIAAVLSPLRALASEKGQLAAFTVAWTAIVLIPMLGVILFSFLRGRGIQVQWAFTLDAYREIVATGRFIVVERTLLMAGAVTLTCLLLGFPFAFWLARRVRSRAVQEGIWMALTVPFFLDPSARTLVWRAILGTGGLVNLLLQNLGLTSGPVEWLLFSPFSVFFGLVGPYFPNMVWPIYLAILLVPDDVMEAARDLGAGPAAVVRDVVVPLALPGIVAGLIFTFIPVLGDTISPTLLGGSQEYLGVSISSLVRSLKFTTAAAFATLILALAFVLLLLAGAIARAFRAERAPA